MNSILFRNAGVIDERSIRTFGISAKIGTNPIGYFGTGLKYAIAVLLREGCELELFAGHDKYTFTTKRISQRGKEFDIILMNDSEMPFTTELGKNWEVWQAFRELYCNALDEKGEVLCDEGRGFVHCQEDTLFVARGEKIEEAFKIKDKIVLNLPERLRFHNGHVQIFDAPSNHIYYRGIRVGDLQGSAMFTYNVTSEMTLTEDRTLKNMGSAMSLIHREIAKISDHQLIRRVLLAPKETVEFNFDFSPLQYYDTGTSDAFYSVLEREFKRNNDRLNKSAIQTHIKRVQAKKPKHYEPEDMSTVEKKQLERAKKICYKIWPEMQDYKILVVKNLGEQTMGLADASDQCIVVSKRAFQLGTKYLTSTLIEEFFHLKTGYGDFTNELQTYLFDTICSLIENYVITEPL
jgi:hypothetical protein